MLVIESLLRSCYRVRSLLVTAARLDALRPLLETTTAPVAVADPRPLPLPADPVASAGRIVLHHLFGRA